MRPSSVSWKQAPHCNRKFLEEEKASGLLEADAKHRAPLVRESATETAGSNRMQPDWSWLQAVFRSSKRFLGSLRAGLVGGNTRDGSTPFSRMRKPPLAGGFRVSGSRLRRAPRSMVRQSGTADARRAGCSVLSAETESEPQRPRWLMQRQCPP